MAHAEPILSSLLCCTWGHEGASALELPSFKYKHSPAYTEEKAPVVECVLKTIDLKTTILTLNSTVGAGDTFTSGMLYGLLCHSDDWDSSHKLRFANELAGRKATQEGFSGLGSSMLHAL